MISRSLLDISDAAPKLGDAITAEAELRGVDAETLALTMLEHPTAVSISVEDIPSRVNLIPGHILGSQAYGPIKQCDVMVIGKMPSKEDSSWRRLWKGKYASFWLDILREQGIDTSTWYVSNACRFVPPSKIKTLKASWVNECRWLLHQEIHILKPKFILLFGADALKVLFGNKFTLSKVRGSNDLYYMGAECIVTVHPAAVVAEPVNYPGFKKDIVTFGNLTLGRKQATMSRQYVVVDNEKDLGEIVDLLVQKNTTRFAVDTEWGGLNGCEFPEGQLRCIQFSHTPGSGVCVVLRHEGLVDAFKPDVATALNLLKKLFHRPGVEVAGHNFRSDLKFLVKEGLDITAQFLNGFDTMLAHHILHPTELQGLENLSIKYTDLGRYDRPLADWLTEHRYNKEKMQQFGYAMIPAALLYPYSCADTDVVIRCWGLLEKTLKESKLGPEYGPYTFGTTNVSNLYDFYRRFVHGVHLPLQEIETTGLLADRERLVDLANLFTAKRDELITGFKEFIRWPDFNFRSVDHVRELLFGTQIGSEKLRPDGAACFELTPLKTTGKPAKDWNNLTDEERATASPSTDAESLQILAADCDLRH